MTNRIKQLLSILNLLLLVTSTSYAAESLMGEVKKEKEENPERWFQIEVIVFQHSNLSDLKAEQWPEHIINRDYQDVVDFLSPIPSVMQTLEEDTEKLNSESEEKTNITELIPVLLAPETELPMQDPPLFNFELFKSELPFLPLQKQFFTMPEKLNAIKRSRNYRLLRHMTWRQPVFGEKQAVSVRILGGDDFAKNFNPDGTKIQKASIVNEFLIDNLESSNQIQTDEIEFTPDDLINAQIIESQPLDAENYFDLIETEESLALEEPPVNDFQILNIALPHVWELDGFIKVHLKRYLHIKLDLEIKQLQEKLISAEQFEKFTDSQDFLKDDNEEAGFEINWESATNSDLNVFVSPENISTDTLKIEYLQPYPLKQQRRVRSTEVHYFDNPILGVVVLITPYDNLPEPEEEEQEDFGFSQ